MNTSLVYPPAQPGGEATGSQPGKNARTPKELVREKYSSAYAYDDGEFILIRVRKLTTGNCPHCYQVWTRMEDNLIGPSLGSGGNEEAAWKDAAQCLGLVTT